MYTPEIPRNFLFSAAQQIAANLPEWDWYSHNIRLERGLTLALEGAVTPISDSGQAWDTNLFEVRSANQWAPPYSYDVDLDEETCTCPDFANGHICKHIYATQILQQAACDLLEYESD